MFEYLLEHVFSYVVMLKNPPEVIALFQGASTRGPRGVDILDVRATWSHTMGP